MQKSEAVVTFDSKTISAEQQTKFNGGEISYETMVSPILCQTIDEHVETLVVRDFPDINQLSSMLLPCIEAFPNITAIHFVATNNHSEKLTADTLEELLRVLAKKKNLKELVLNNDVSDIKYYPALKDTLKNNLQLTKLDINATDKLILKLNTVFNPALQPLFDLQHLALRCDSLMLRSVEPLEATLKVLPSIEFFDSHPHFFEPRTVLTPERKEFDGRCAEALDQASLSRRIYQQSVSRLTMLEILASAIDNNNFAYVDDFHAQFTQSTQLLLERGHVHAKKLIAEGKMKILLPINLFKFTSGQFTTVEKEDAEDIISSTFLNEKELELVNTKTFQSACRIFLNMLSAYPADRFESDPEAISEALEFCILKITIIISKLELDKGTAKERESEKTIAELKFDLLVSAYCLQYKLDPNDDENKQVLTKIELILSDENTAALVDERLVRRAKDLSQSLFEKTESLGFAC